MVIEHENVLPESVGLAQSATPDPPNATDICVPFPWLAIVKLAVDGYGVAEFPL
jgi:hypothetical protein